MSVTLKASKKGLEIIDRARKQKGWNKREKAWYELALTSEATLARFWRCVSIQRDTFIDICNVVEVNWENVVDLTPINSAWIEFSVYDDGWVGRETLIQDLNNVIRSSSKILLLLGITGIGKTALAERIIKEVRGEWSELRINFENGNKNADFASTAIQWLEQWGIPVNKDDLKPEQLRKKIIKQLQTNQYLIFLDSLEYQLTWSEDEGWGDFKDPCWNEFFVSFLAEPNCKSYIIITSQDLPVQFYKKCDRYKNFWHLQLVRGLNPTEQIELFQKMGLKDAQKSNLSPLRLMGEIYDGHPLALRTIAGEIKESWHGSVAAYWNKYRNYIEEVKQALEEAKNQGNVQGEEDRWKLASYTEELGRKVKERLDQTFQRLQEDLPIAYRLICFASVYRCEIEEKCWLTFLQFEGYSSQKQEEAIQALRDRYLVEDVGINHQYERLVKQHNLIRSIAIEHRTNLLGDN